MTPNHLRERGVQSEVSPRLTDTSNACTNVDPTGRPDLTKMLLCPKVGNKAFGLSIPNFSVLHQHGSNRLEARQHHQEKTSVLPQATILLCCTPMCRSNQAVFESRSID